MTVYIVMFPQECGYCDPGIEKIFLCKSDADRFCNALNIAEEIKDENFRFFVKEFEVF